MQLFKLGKRKRLAITSNVKDKHGLVSACAASTIQLLSPNALERQCLFIDIESKVPVAVGLKSSSAISTAVVISVAQALTGKSLPAKTILKVSCRASITSGASITGAYDDACACLLGGIVLTDNRKFLVLKRTKLPTYLGKILRIMVTREKKVYTSSIRREYYMPFKAQLTNAFALALKGNFPAAMLSNSVVQCSVLGYSIRPVSSALEEGAECSGISGKGPSVGALCTTNKIANRVSKRWMEEAHESVTVIKR